MTTNPNRQARRQARATNAQQDAKLQRMQDRLQAVTLKLDLMEAKRVAIRRQRRLADAQKLAEWLKQKGYSDEV